MTKRESGFRIFGDELGREEAYLDVDVTGADSSGNIYIEEAGNKNSEEWKLTPDKLTRLFEDELAIGGGDIPVPKHKMWKVLDDIGETRSNVDINSFVDDRLKESAKGLFRALIEVGK